MFLRTYSKITLEVSGGRERWRHQTVLGRAIKKCFWCGAVLASVVSLSQVAGAESAQPAVVAAPSTTSSLVEQVTFGQQAARVGDRVAQHVKLAFEVETTVMQAGQVAHHSTAAVHREQQRFIEVTEVNQGRVRRAHVFFPISRLSSPNSAPAESEEVESVEGKSYWVTRQGEQLQVTDTSGHIPPEDEYVIVHSNLQTLGLPSPLAKYLQGRSLAVGEKLDVPPQVAAEMMGFDPTLGPAHSCQLELKSTREVDGEPCAVFATTITAVRHSEQALELKASGEVVLQIATCRTIDASLQGPLQMNQDETTPAGDFQQAAAGHMRVALHSDYGHAPR